MSRKRVTIGDIAKHLGVAPSTVSRALSGKGRINEATRTRIRNTAEELGYQEDAFLSMLMTQLKKQPGETDIHSVMAWLSFAPEPDYFSGTSPLAAYYEEAKRTANELGFELTEFWLGDSSLTAGRLNQILETRGIEGVLIAPYAKFDVTWNLDWSRLAPCAIEFTPFQQELTRIGIYDFYNISLIIDQLEAAGYSRIGYVVRPLHETNQFYIMQARFAMQVLEASEGQGVPTLVLGVEESEQDAETFRQWREAYQPDAIATNVVSVKPWLQAEGLSVPDDVALAHQDICLLPPGEDWSGVDPQYGEIARRAVQEVANRVKNRTLGLSSRAESTYIKGIWHQGPTS